MAHPFVNAARVKDFIGKPVALLGKVEKVEANQFSLTTTDEKTVNIVKFREDAKALVAGQTVEVRGIANSADTLSFEDLTQFEGDFGKYFIII